jgi:predicted ester cyclase
MSARDLALQAWDHIESGDTGRLAALFHPDAELTTSAGGGRGREYITELFVRHRSGYPDVTHRILDSIESGDGAAVALRLEFRAHHLGELRGPFGPVAPTGRELVWRSSDVVRSEGGLITSWHAMFDRLTVLQQLGLLDQLPPAVSTASVPNP